MTSTVVNRLVAYGTAPETYDPPTPAECVQAAAGINEARKALIEAHMLICFNYQSMMKPPSQTDGRYENSMWVWNLECSARDMMTHSEQDLFDALLKCGDLT